MSALIIEASANPGAVKRGNDEKRVTKFILKIVFIALCI